MSELVSNGVQIYQFPTDEETVAEINATMSVCFLGREVCLPWFAWAHPDARARCTRTLLALKLQAGQEAFGAEMSVAHGLLGLGYTRDSSLSVVFISFPCCSLPILGKEESGRQGLSTRQGKGLGFGFPVPNHLLLLSRG